MTQILEAKERNSKDIEKILHPLVKEWFFSKFENFSLPQKEPAWRESRQKQLMF